MSRVGLEWILELHLRGSPLLIDPCVRKAWRSFEIAFRITACATTLRSRAHVESAAPSLASSSTESGRKALRHRHSRRLTAHLRYHEIRSWRRKKMYISRL